MCIEGQLLCRGYKFSEVITLDLYGFPADETSGIEVTTATLPGSDVSLADMLTRKQLIAMTEWLERNSQPADMSAQIDRAEDDKLLRQHEHVWRTF